MIGLLSTHFKKQEAPERQARILRRETAPPGAYQQETKRAGLLCTGELEEATRRCRAKVEAIAKQSPATADSETSNSISKKTRSDAFMASAPLQMTECLYTPSDVMRVTQIFQQPQFFIDGAKWSDIMQGRIGDCWLLSALATVSTMEDLIEKICVARDEKVGVYGFIFYRDSGWVDVIVDDLLYTSIPKYEQLSRPEKNLYHNDKDKYNTGARRGGQSLYFAKSGTENETWVPLLEKAYAKLHGDYSAIDGGLAADAIEDLTGYGKRFLRIRNPWGKTEWTGAWSDGSKEWTSEWLALLPMLNHKFGNDGEFLMEYTDFLNTWTMIERSRLFDSGWKMSSMWLDVKSRSFPCAWNYGDVSFTLSVKEDTPAVIVLSQLDDRYFSEISGYSQLEDTPAVIVLSQLDDRYFSEISGYSQWTLEFMVYQKGAPASDAYASSAHTIFWRRSVNVELGTLEAGDYVVHVRLDRRHIRSRTYFQDSIGGCDHRKLSKVWSEACVASSIAVNFDPKAYGDLLPAAVDAYGGQDLTEIELAFHERNQKKPVEGNVSPSNAKDVPIIRPPRTPPVDHPQARKDVSATSDKDVPIIRPPRTPPVDEPQALGPPSVDGSEVVVDSQPEPSSPGVPVFETEGRIAELVNVNNDPDDEGKPFPRPDDDKPLPRPGDYKPVPGPDDDDKADKDDIPPPNPELLGPVPPSPGRPQGVVHEGWRCDGCGTDPIIGPRYHCLSSHCPDYDLCQSCMSKNVHDPSHSMLCVRDPADGDKLRDDVAEGEDNSIILGLRVYTKGTTAEIAGQLRHGKVVAWDRKKI
ncbi:hypothetical protein RSAG8_12271, partial [Rhizoctonia solani AG-8 WAC10335]